jgi:hypothetical protein
LDVYIPSLSLAFEYQGIQHYEDLYYFGAPLRVYNERDEIKRKLCAAANITLIEIPYWWDNTKTSLQATIHHTRPDLVDPSPSEPIPHENPNSVANSTYCL